MKLFDLQQDLICIANKDGYFTELNGAWEKTLEISTQELTSEPFINFIFEDDRENTITELSKLFTGNHKTTNFINRYIKKNGTYIYLSWRAAYISDKDLIIAIADEVTEREEQKKHVIEVKNKLEQKQKELQIILDHMPAYIFYKDKKNNILLANKAAANSMGLKPEDMAGKHTREFYPEHAGLYYNDDLQVLNSKKARLGIEEKYIGSTGETRWVRTDKIPVIDENGEAKHIIAIANDITKEKLDARALEEQNKSLKLILEGTQLGFWELNNQTGEMKLDEIWHSMLGYKKGDFEENIESAVNLVHPEDKEHVLKTWEYHLENRTASFEAIFRMQHKDGTWRWISDKGLVISRDENNQPIKSIGIHQDISHIKQTEDQLQKMNLELLRSNKELDDFAHIASHDLREPLRGIHYNSNFLLEDYAETIDDKGKERLERLIFLTQRMNHLVDDLLYFARLGKGDLLKEEVDLHTVAENAINSLNDAPHTEIKIVNKLPKEVCDKVKMDTLFSNLIQNAIKYNDKDKIIIELGSFLGENGKNIFFVKDNGIGIAENHHEEIFKIFRRVVKKNSYGGGTGSGLSFVKKIIDLHKGNIWLESKLGEGTTFFFTLWCK